MAIDTPKPIDPSAPPAVGVDSPRPAAAAATISVLTNPYAAGGRHRPLFDRIVAALGEGGHPVTVLDATDRAGALAAASAAVAGGAGALVAVGGDGTMHVGLQAVAGTGTPFAIVPAGSGNDFAEALGVPGDPVVAAGGIGAAFAAGRTRPVVLARVTTADGGSLWFGAVLGAGFDAIVNERANRMRFPRGPRRYDVATYAELARLKPRPYTITLDGEERRLDAVLVAVGNTRCYGGGMQICPQADPTDGLLDVVIGGLLTRTTVIKLRPALYAGTHVDHPQVQQFQVREVRIEAEGITTYADGERALPLPVTITAVPGALNLLG